jgi:protein-S-isoprenylcysteine O-methyltransferase Ste14
MSLRKGTSWVLLQIPLLLAAFALPSLMSSRTLPWPDETHSWRQTISVLVAVAGVLLLTFGTFRLGRNLTPFPRPKAAGTLVTTGVYRIVRHPIYSGIVFLAVASAVRAPTVLVLPLPVMVFLFFDAKARFEEKWLVQRFTDYPAYQVRTAKLIPWLY